MRSPSGIFVPAWSYTSTSTACLSSSTVNGARAPDKPCWLESVEGILPKVCQTSSDGEGAVMWGSSPHLLFWDDATRTFHVGDLSLGLPHQHTSKAQPLCVTSWDRRGILYPRIQESKTSILPTCMTTTVRLASRCFTTKTRSLEGFDHTAATTTDDLSRPFATHHTGAQWKRSIRLPLEFGAVISSDRKVAAIELPRCHIGALSIAPSFTVAVNAAP